MRAKNLVNDHGTLLVAPGVQAAKNEEPSSVVSGLVLTMQDEPVDGVVVAFTPTDRGELGPTTTTDASGAFTITLHAGQYVLKLAKDVEDALRVYLSRKTPRSNYKLQWSPEHGRLQPGVNLDDRDALFDLMDGRT